MSKVKSPFLDNRKNEILVALQKALPILSNLVDLQKLYKSNNFELLLSCKMLHTIGFDTVRNGSSKVWANNQPPDAPRGSNNQQCFLAVLRLQRVLARGDRALTVAKQENLGGVRDALIELLREDLVDVLVKILSMSM